MWCIPPAGNARFVADMEDILEVYAREPDPDCPLVCLDEFCKQLVSEVRTPIPAKAGSTECIDSEYCREGSASAFMMVAPHLGRREVFISEEGRRRAIDYADAIAFLREEMFPDVREIILVQDNLNTHGRHSLYERFEPERARQLAEGIHWHYTPKHGSWLNIAEIEISVLSRAALDTRIEGLQTFRSEIQAAVKRRNSQNSTIDWQFQSEDARTKLRHVYPSF